MSGLKLITPPTSEPLDLTSDVKPYLRVNADETSNDAFIQMLIGAAREAAEKLTARGLCTQTWRQSFDYFPGHHPLERLALRMRHEYDSHRHRHEHCELMRSPLNDDTFVLKYLDVNGQEQTVDPSIYKVDAESDPAKFRLARDAAWPAHAPEPNAVWVEFVVGYGAKGETVPSTDKIAMLYLINHWYENREAIQEGAMLEIPMTFTTLLGLNKVRYA